MKWTKNKEEEPTEEPMVDSKTIKTTTKGNKRDIIVVEYTREEVESRIRDLQNDEDLALFLKVTGGERKFSEFQKLVKLLDW